MSIRILFRLAAVVLGVLMLAAVQAPAAQAADAVGCRIAPGSTFEFTNNCVNDRPATSYSVAFHAPDGAGSYAWSISGDWVSVVVGCGASDAYCTVSTGGSNRDRSVFADVNVGGVAYSFGAFINMYCGRVLC